MMLESKLLTSTLSRSGLQNTQTLIIKNLPVLRLLPNISMIVILLKNINNHFRNLQQQHAVKCCQVNRSNFKVFTGPFRQREG